VSRFYFSLFLALFLFTLAAAQNARKGYFITKLGRDTTAVEEYASTAHELTGTAVSRSPRTTIREYKVTFDAAGNIIHLHLLTRLENGALVNEREYAYSDDSIVVSTRQDTTHSRSVIAVQGRPFPLFIDLFGPWEAILRKALSTGGKKFSLAARRPMHYAIEGHAPGMLELNNTDGDFGPIHATVGEGGELEKFDMTATTDKIVAERTGAVDVLALAKEFTERERHGQQLGVLSPRDTVRGEIHGAHIVLDYGRPAVRGRTIFGQVVPWDSVWRTGANAATQLTTDKRLRFGDVAVAPGTYTIFTIPGPDRWLLIINSQHGQWGTEYDKTKDLGRTAMKVRSTNEPAERFTISLTEEGDGGVLHLMWDRTEAFVPFRAE